MNSTYLKNRNKQFNLDSMAYYKNIPKSRELDSIVRQLVRASSSVGVNYRAACRALSDKDFLNNLKIIEE